MKNIMVWVIRVVLVAAIIFAGWKWGMPWYRTQFGAKTSEAYVPTAKAREDRLVISFHEIGTLQAEKSVPVVSMVNGKIIYLITEGTVVKEGDKIAEMDTSELNREVQNQILNHNNAIAEVEKAMKDMELLKKSNETLYEQAEMQQRFFETEMERAASRLEQRRELFERKLVTKPEVDQAQIDYDSKKLSVEKGKLDLELKAKENKTREDQKAADIRNVQFRETMARMQLEDVQRRMKNAVITAPAPGLVVLSADWTPEGRRKLQAGDNARPMQTICQLPDLRSMLVKVKIGEADAPRLTVGMPTIIRLEAVPGKVFKGEIKEVTTIASEAMPWEAGATPGKKTFDVTIRVLQSDPSTHRPGMTADVEFIEATIEKTVFIPHEAVIEEKGKQFVYVKTGSGWKKRAVTLGRSNDMYVAVTKGLAKNEVIALKDPVQAEQEAREARGEKANGKQTPPLPNETP